MQSEILEATALPNALLEVRAEVRPPRVAECLALQPGSVALSEENERLREENARLHEERAKLLAENEKLRKEVEKLKEDLLDSKRAAKRQAAPFRRRELIPLEKQKKPGRKPGHLPAFQARPPAGEPFDETRVALNGCPDCGCRELSDPQEHEHWTRDIPRVRPRYHRHVTHSAWCPCCQRRQHSTSPLATTEATGAASVVLGPNAAGLAAYMRVAQGIPLAKLARFFRERLEIAISPAGILCVLHRVALCLTDTYELIQAALQMSLVVHVDETGWRVRAVSAWMWVFTNSRYTFYCVAYSRGSDVVYDVLGADFSGCLASDFLPTYDAFKCPDKAKCLSHLLRALSDVEKVQAKEEDRRFPAAAKELIKDAMALKAVKAKLPQEVFERLRKDIEDRLDTLLAEEHEEPNNLRLANRMRKHRPHLLTFLRRDEVDPTNNLAERQIRPIVLERKISAGNRSDQGARMHSILGSVYATCCQHGVDFVNVVVDALVSNGRPAAFLANPP